MAQDSCLIEFTLMFIVAALKVLDGVRGMGRGEFFTSKTVFSTKCPIKHEVHTGIGQYVAIKMNDILEAEFGNTET